MVVLNLYPTKLNGLCFYINWKGGWATYCRSGGRKERKGGNEKKAMEMRGEVI